ncbi:MAG: transposase [Pirellulaceae bacterium]|nr:transposase [Pirellulaceae bacterium]
MSCATTRSSSCWPTARHQDLASQPTLSRFENSVTPRSLLRLEEFYLDRFVNSFEERPREVTLDVDVFDDPAHGQQQMIFYHGHYQQYQYLVRAITCAENDLVALPVLLHGTAEPALGVGVDLQRVVSALRAKLPGFLIRLRADAGYAKPWLYRLCEPLDVEYSISIGMNRVLKQQTEELLQTAVQQCEANFLGTNRRVAVTYRPGARTLPEGAYDESSERGESENRNKELRAWGWR